MNTINETPETTSKLIPNSFQVPNWYVDVCMSLLMPSEIAILVFLMRKIFGWGKSSDRVSKRQIMQGTGLGSDAVDKALANLVRFGLVLRLAENHAQLNRGIEWGLQLDSELVDLAAMQERANIQREKGRAKTVSARQARREQGGGDVQQPHLETASVEQKSPAGGDVQQPGGGDDEQPGGGDVQHPTQNPIKPTIQNPPSLPTSLHTDEPGGREGWRFAQIAENNILNRKSIQALQTQFPDEQTLSQEFVALILYAFSDLGKGLNDSSGVSNAIRNLTASEPKFAPQKFRRLAKLGAQRLRELIDRDYAREDLGSSVEAQIYRSHFAHLSLERRNDLYYRLFGADAPERAAKPNTATESVLARRLKQSRKEHAS